MLVLIIYFLYVYSAAFVICYALEGVKDISLGQLYILIGFIPVINTMFCIYLIIEFFKSFTYGED